MNDLTTLDSLPVLAAQINQAHDLACRSAQSAIRYAITVGDKLIEAKAMLKHGEWLPWLAENFDFSDRTAQDYMRLTQHRREIETKSASDPDFTIREALMSLRKNAGGKTKSAAVADLVPSPDPSSAAPLVPVNTEQAKPRRPSKDDRIAELEKMVCDLEVENARLKARLKQDEEYDWLWASWREGGWETVVRKIEDDFQQEKRELLDRLKVAESKTAPGRTSESGSAEKKSAVCARREYQNPLVNASSE